MRLKLIALFSLIVVVVGGLAYALSTVALRPLTQQDSNEPNRAVGAAVAQLEVEGLATERWLSTRAADPALREPFGRPDAAKGEAATEAADKVSEAAKTAPELQGVKAAQIMIVNAAGVVLGRNGSKLGRGDDLGAVYPSLQASLKAGTPMSDVWVSQARDEQLLASYAPIRGADGAVLGGLVFASAITNERLTDASNKTSGHALALAVKRDQGLGLVAKSSNVDEALEKALVSGAAATAAMQTLTSGETQRLSGLPDGYSGHAKVLDGYGDGRRAVVVAVVKPAEVSLGSALLWPALVAMLVGILLVVGGAVLLDAYLSRPLSEIEDGLLAIMNGQTNRRLEIEHAELGGLVFRINSLLNQLFGVTEDDTDEEGRPSRAPTGRGFTDALAVDESVAMSGASAADAAALFAEAEDAYYARVFGEYIQAKRGVGDPTDHITQGDFVARLQGSEQELAQKHGKPVRFKVEAKGKEVVLIAVPQG